MDNQEPTGWIDSALLRGQVVHAWMTLARATRTRSLPKPDETKEVETNDVVD